jgi:Tfp pilus assembly PilM family ATPase
MSVFDQYLSGIGVDISNHHVRIAQMTSFSSIQKLIEIDLPEGLVQDERVISAKALKEIVNKRLEKEGLLNGGLRTTLLVPESRVFASSLLLPATKKGEEARHEAIDRAQREIPIPFEQAVVVVSQGARQENEIRHTVYAIDKGVFDGLRQVFDPLHVRMIAMEANSKALLRIFQRYGQSNLQVKDLKTLIGLVDIGHSWATISLYLKDGSNLFSRTLSYKSAGGVRDATHLPQITVDLIHSTIEEVVVYFSEKQTKIGLFLFAGVEAEDERFKKDGLFYQMGDVVTVGDQKKRAIHTYGAAIGAAMRSVHPFQYSHQHNFIKGQ